MGRGRDSVPRGLDPRREAEALRYVIEAVLPEHPLPEALGKLLTAMVKALGADGGVMALLEGDVLRPRAWVGRHRSRPEDMPLGRGPAWEALRQGGTVVSPTAEGARGAQTVVCTPLPTTGGPVGVALLEFRRAAELQAPRKALLERMAGMAGQAIALVRLREQERLATKRQQALQSIMEASLRSQDLDALLRDLLVAMMEHCGADFGAVRLVEPETGLVRPVAAIGIDPGLLEVYPLGAPLGVTARGLASGHPVSVGGEELQQALVNPALKQMDLKGLAVAPILLEGQVVGSFTLGFTSNPPCSQDDLALLDMMASISAHAIRRAQLLEAEAQARRELEALERITEAGLSSLEPRQALQALLRRVVEVTGAVTGTLWTLEEDGHTLVCRASHGVPPEEVHPRVDARLPIWERIWASEKPVVYSREELQSPAWSPYTRKLGLAMVLVIRLQVGEHSLGTVSLGYREPVADLERHTRLLSVVAERMAMVLERTLAHQRVQALAEAEAQARRELEALEQVAAAGLSSLEPQEMLETVLARLGRVTGADLAAVRLLEPERGVLRLQAVWGPYFKTAPEEMPLEGSAAGLALREGRTVMLTGPDLDAVKQRFPGGMFQVHQIDCYAATPLKGRSGLQGVVGLMFRRPPQTPHRLLELLTLAADRITMALENARAYQAMRDLAMRDGLTGALNRRELFRRLEEEVGQCQRAGKPLSVLMVDLDDFKEVNETLGHMAGDQVLKEVVQEVMVPSVRVYDVVARYGGDEFAILLPETGKDDAFRVAERLLARMKAHRVRHPGLEGRVITASMGIATAPEDAGDATALIERADDALRLAKSTGKGRIHTLPRRA